MNKPRGDTSRCATFLSEWKDLYKRFAMNRLMDGRIRANIVFVEISDSQP